MSASPAEDLRAAFDGTDDEALLTMYARLTHQVHALTASLDDGVLTGAERVPKRQALADLRAQRDLVQGEALRRMGEGR